MSTRTEDVINRLRESVLDGAIAPGTHLHEETLAQSLGVSRTPIRDALRVLANENLLVYSPNRGYAVRRFALEEILGAYDVRGTLEGMACRLAAERGLREAAAEDLDAVMASAAAILHGGAWTAAEQQEWRSLNGRFHARVVDESGNPSLASIARQMRRLPRMHDPRLDPDHDTFQAIYTLAQARQSHAEHNAILDAIRHRQGTRAEALMREHVYRNRELVRHSVAASGQGHAQGRGQGKEQGRGPGGA